MDKIPITSSNTDSSISNSNWSYDSDMGKHKCTPKSVPKLTKEETDAKYKKKASKVSVCLTHCKYHLIKNVARNLGFKPASDYDNYNLIWIDSSITVERCKELKRYQRMNHFPGMLQICRKDLLARNLNRMRRLFPADYTFFPKTWSLPIDYSALVHYAKQFRNKTYILKPESGSQGRGITITKSLKNVLVNTRGICQVYISKPFLIEGLKFDLRLYTLIASCDPLRIYIYNEGLVRFATCVYREPNAINLTNAYMHLTNYSINKHSMAFVKDPQGYGSKRKLSWLNNYLEHLNYDVAGLWKVIDDVIIKTVISGYPILKQSYAASFPNHDIFPACCELLGIDVILDKYLTPYVLEVNHCPSFHTDSRIDSDVKEALITDMFQMMNLEKYDKHKIINEDRMKLVNRLVHGRKEKDETKLSVDSFKKCFKKEFANRGGFRLIYPPTNSVGLPSGQGYLKFFEQGESSIYCKTASSKAREAAQSALREEMKLKIKLEESKRLSALIQIETVPVTERKKLVKSKISTNKVKVILKNSFKPQFINTEEERKRLAGLIERDYLLRNNRMIEVVYFSLKENNLLRSEDERKYGILEKIREATNMVNRNSPDMMNTTNNLPQKSKLIKKYTQQ